MSIYNDPRPSKSSRFSPLHLRARLALLIEAERVEHAARLVSGVRSGGASTSSTSAQLNEAVQLVSGARSGGAKTPSLSIQVDEAEPVEPLSGAPGSANTPSTSTQLDEAERLSGARSGGACTPRTSATATCRPPAGTPVRAPREPCAASADAGSSSNARPLFPPMRPATCPASTATASTTITAAASISESGSPLLNLAHDLVELLVRRGRLLNPLQPESALALSATCREMRSQLRPALRLLRPRHVAVRELCRKAGTTTASAGAAESLGWDCKGLDDADCATLGALLAHGVLDHVTTLTLHGNALGDDAIAALFAGLGLPSKSALPHLRSLGFETNTVGDRALAAIARVALGANGTRVLPALRDLQISNNKIGDSGLFALGRALHDPAALPQLQRLWATGNPFAERAAREFRCLVAKRNLGLVL